MFIANLIKFLIIFFFVYLIIRIFKSFVIINRNAKRTMENQRRDEKINRQGKDSGKIIELDKDQYKVE